MAVTLVLDRRVGRHLWHAAGLAGASAPALVSAGGLLAVAVVPAPAILSSQITFRRHFVCYF